MVILEQNFKWNLEAFASELFKCTKSLHLWCFYVAFSPLWNLLATVGNPLSWVGKYIIHHSITGLQQHKGEYMTEFPISLTISFYYSVTPMLSCTTIDTLQS